MTVLSIINFAVIFYMMGQSKVPRWIFIALAAGIIVLKTPDFASYASYLWIFYVVKLLPTQAMFSAVNGGSPARGDGWWQFLQDAAFRVWFCLPIKWQNWHLWGIIYGFFHAIMALPAMVYLGTGYIFLGMGLIYYLMGVVNRRFPKVPAVAASEVICGMVFGFILSNT